MKAITGKINKTIKEHHLLKRKDKVVVGFSGGPDSTALFLILMILREKFELDLMAAHVNYGERKNAQKEEEFCREFCRRNKIPLEVLKVKGAGTIIPNRIKKIRNFEERARKIRYYFFEKLVKKTGATKIAVAHNLDDQAETVLGNFIRGSGLEGIGGISYSRGKIVRPLLNVSRKEIFDFLEEKKQKYVLDESNWDLKFKRNRIRHELIKEIKEKYNPNILKTLGRNSFLYREAWKFLKKEGQKKLEALTQKKKEGNWKINWQKAQKESLLIKSIILRIAIKEITGSLKNVSQDLIFKTVNYLDNPEKKKVFREIRKLTVRKIGARVFLTGRK